MVAREEARDGTAVRAPGPLGRDAQEKFGVAAGDVLHIEGNRALTRNRHYLLTMSRMVRRFNGARELSIGSGVGTAFLVEVRSHVLAT